MDILFYFFFSLTIVIYINIPRKSFLVRFLCRTALHFVFLTSNHKVCLMAPKSLLFLCFRESSGARMQWNLFDAGDLCFHVQCFQIKQSMCFETYFYILICLLLINIMVIVNFMFKYLK